jgi:hypothetical protein
MSVNQVERDSENLLLFTFTRCRGEKSSLSITNCLHVLNVCKAKKDGIIKGGRESS